MYRSPISRQLLKTLTTKRDLESAFRVGLHVGILLLTAAAALWASNAGLWLLVLPVVMLHGMVFTFLGYAGMGHELHHGTVFTSPTLNTVLFHAVSFLTWSNPVYFRASHTHHHKHTLETGSDFEVSPKPYPLLEVWWRYAFLDVDAFKRAWMIFSQNAQGLVKGPFGERAFPMGSTARRALVNTARIHLALHLLLALGFLALGQPVLLLLITFANFICTLPNRVLAKLQHSNMSANSSDYRENSRTVVLPGWLAFLYWNMNYHIEHHMYPGVPYCNLPALRKAIAHDLPASTPGVLPNLKHIRMPKA